MHLFYFLWSFFRSFFCHFVSHSIDLCWFESSLSQVVEHTCQLSHHFSYFYIISNVWLAYKLLTYQFIHTFCIGSLLLLVLLLSLLSLSFSFIDLVCDQQTFREQNEALMLVVVIIIDKDSL